MQKYADYLESKIIELTPPSQAGEDMKTAEDVAQWAINNRYPKSENEKVSDHEYYHQLVEAMHEFRNQGISFPSEAEIKDESEKLDIELRPTWVVSARWAIERIKNGKL